MTDYTSNVTLQEAAQRIAAARRVLVTTHAKPDGDAFGAVLALSCALRQLGKAVTAVVMPPVPPSFLTLREAKTVAHWSDAPSSPAPPKPDLSEGPDRPREDTVPPILTAADITNTDPDLVIIADTGAWSQLAPMRGVLEPRLDRTLILDHHLRGDVPAAQRYIDGSAAAACEIIAQLIEALAATSNPSQDLLSPAVCDALFVGISSDTGWFRFSNTTARTHELAAELLRRGVDAADLYMRTEQTERPAKLGLMARALASVELLADGRAAIMVLRAADFAACGARLDETERIIDLPQVVEQVRVVALVTEPADAVGGAAIRVSLRSKPGPDAVNVSDLAARFGGGGHARAAGAKIKAPVDEVVKRVRHAIESVLT